MIALILLALLIKLLIDLPVMLVGYPAVLLAFFWRTTHEDSGDRQGTITHYPRWAWAWDNADHGIDGQGFYRDRTLGWPYWLRCFVWSAIRNPSFNWSKYMLGFLSGGKAVVVRGTTAPVGDSKGPGWYFARERWAWEFYGIVPYTFRGKRKCLRLRAGWKLLNKSKGERCQFVFAPSLYKEYSGV